MIFDAPKGIIITLYYLIKINNNENKVIESFSQKNSLSTYFQQTVDSNLYESNYLNNKYNSTISNQQSDIESLWNGNWKNSTVPVTIYSSFLQINEKIIFTISKKISDIITIKKKKIKII